MICNPINITNKVQNGMLVLRAVNRSSRAFRCHRMRTRLARPQWGGNNLSCPLQESINKPIADIRFGKFRTKKNCLSRRYLIMIKYYRNGNKNIESKTACLKIFRFFFWSLLNDTKPILFWKSSASSRYLPISFRRYKIATLLLHWFTL